MSEADNVRAQTATQRQSRDDTAGSAKTTYADPQTNLGTDIHSATDFPVPISENTGTLNVDQEILDNQKILNVDQEINQENLNVDQMQDPQAQPQQTPEKDATNISATDKPPYDYGRIDTDKVKVTDGDIIDFFCGEIRDFIAWGVDKAGAIPGIFFYEMAHAAGRESYNLWQDSKEGVKDIASNVHKKLNPSCDNMEELRANHKETVQALNEAYTTNEKFLDNASVLQNVVRGIVSGQYRWEDCKLKDITTGRFVPDWKMPEDAFKASMDQATEALLDHVYEISGSTSEEEKGHAKKVFQAYNRQWVRDMAQKEGTPLPKDLEDCKDYDNDKLLSKNPKIVEACRDVMSNFMNADDRRAYIPFYLSKLNLQADLFAEYYSQYQINSFALDNPQDTILTKKNGQKTLVEKKNQAFNEGRAIFFQLNKDRREGKDIPSNEELLETVAKQCEKSESKKTADEIRKLCGENVGNTSQPQTLADLAKNTNETLGELRNNYETLLREESTLTQNPKKSANTKAQSDNLNQIIATLPNNTKDGR